MRLRGISITSVVIALAQSLAVWGQTDIDERLDRIEERSAEIRSRLADHEGDAPRLSLTWGPGFRLRTADDSFRMQWRGRVHADWGFFEQSRKHRRRFGGIDDGVEFRRARIALSGVLHDTVIFKADYDFAGGSPKFRDLYIGLDELPGVGRVRVGHVSEPFGLRVSTNALTFMERSLPFALNPSRNTGVRVDRRFCDDRLTWGGGIFRDADEVGSASGDGDFSFTTRLTALPCVSADGARLLHIGGSVSRRKANEGVLRYSSRPEAHLAPRVVDTGDFVAERAVVTGVELAFVRGNVHGSAEWLHSRVARSGVRDSSFHGYHVQAGWFLTGEARPYDRRDGTFGAVVPARRFRDGDGGFGALELAARFSRLDLRSAGIQGGVVENVTVGLNWILDAHVRVMTNWVESVSGARGFDALMMRFQISW